MKKLILSIFVLLSVFGVDAQGLKLPALSPNAKIVQDFSLTNIEINYSRPSMRNRKVFGDLVPYGSVWRTGANAATKIKFGEDIEIAGNKLKAGEYALYTIPGKENWEVIINTGVGNWGAEGYSRENDVLRFKVKPSALLGECQTFTIAITDITYTTCKLELTWEKTKISIPIKAKAEETINKNIDKAIYHPAIPYFQVANYYFENDTKLDIAAMYVDKALEEDGSAFYMWYLKARIEKKLGHEEKAIEAARKSIETAKGSAFEADYIRNNNKLIDDIKKASYKDHSKK